MKIRETISDLINYIYNPINLDTNQINNDEEYIKSINTFFEKYKENSKKS